MTTRTLGFATLAVGVVLLGVQVAVKPRPDPAEIKQIAALGTQPQQWRGRLAPDIQVPMLDRSTFHLAEHVGREVVVLNFFATWCGPCREEMPELQRYAATLVGQHVVFVAIDVQEQQPVVEAFVKAQHFGLPVGLDISAAASGRYGVSAFPTTVIVGADGRIAYYEASAISNADVSLGAIVRGQGEAIAANHGITREAYEAALAKEPTDPPAGGSTEPVLTGRAQRIAQAMPCPCGCDQKVSECTCQTAKAIKARLAAGGYDAKTDAEVMRDLNREFCMKGM